MKRSKFLFVVVISVLLYSSGYYCYSGNDTLSFIRRNIISLDIKILDVPKASEIISNDLTFFETSLYKLSWKRMITLLSSKSIFLLGGVGLSNRNYVLNSEFISPLTKVNDSTNGYDKITTKSYNKEVSGYFSIGLSKFISTKKNRNKWYVDFLTKWYYPIAVNRNITEFKNSYIISKYNNNLIHTLYKTNRDSYMKTESPSVMRLNGRGGVLQYLNFETSIVYLLGDKQRFGIGANFVYTNQFFYYRYDLNYISIELNLSLFL
mgnify:CR=1 FL=1